MYIRAWMSSKFGQIGLLSTKLATTERLKIPHGLIMGKMFFHLPPVVFGRIFLILSGDENMH